MGLVFVNKFMMPFQLHIHRIVFKGFDDVAAAIVFVDIGMINPQDLQNPGGFKWFQYS
jgi:hypothetical protein